MFDLNDERFEDNADHIDRLAAAWWQSGFTDHDPGDVAVSLRLIRAANLIAQRWEVEPGADEEAIAASLDVESIKSAADAFRFMGEMEKQDLRHLLTKITVACGDLPGPV